MIFGGVGAGGPDWGRGSGGRRDNGKQPDGTGSWNQESQIQEQMGQMAVAGGGGVGGPDGRGGGTGD